MNLDFGYLFEKLLCLTEVGILTAELNGPYFMSCLG